MPTPLTLIQLISEQTMQNLASSRSPYMKR